MGVWNRISDLREDPTHKTPESYYGWLAKIGLNPQIVGSSDSQDLTANDNQLRWIRKYFTAADTHYQNVEWLQAYPDLYNRNPFLSSFDGPGMMTPWSYYGETPHAPGLLRDVQHAPIMKELQDYTHDDNLMAILDPDGEVGPFPYFKWASTVRCSDAISSAIFSKFGIFRYRTFRNGTSANPMRSQVGMTSRWPIGVRLRLGRSRVARSPRRMARHARRRHRWPSPRLAKPRLQRRRLDSPQLSRRPDALHTAR